MNKIETKIFVVILLIILVVGYVYMNKKTFQELPSGGKGDHLINVTATIKDIDISQKKAIVRLDPEQSIFDNKEIEINLKNIGEDIYHLYKGQCIKFYAFADTPTVVDKIDYIY